jgi:DNA (cytosine-5)-methyltransferase 1
MTLRVLDLFSGIGGFSLGLERTGGFETMAFCEIEKYPRKVLAKHWPGVPIYDDVRELTADRLIRDGIGVDVICGGFPCQDISNAGNQAGIAEGTRSGLWSECARLLGEIQPRYAIFENVTALLSGDNGRWFQQVLWDISQVGYDVEWHCIPANARAVDAPHRRDRVWIITYPHNEGLQGLWQGRTLQEWSEATRHAGQSGESLEWSWATEPDICRVANGVPQRSHRLKALGNAVVPQIPEIIGRAILEAERQTKATEVDSNATSI